MPLKHYIDHASVSSDLVYPLDQNYCYIAKLDNDWVTSRIRFTFGRDIVRIDNKYVIQIKNAFDLDILIYNHDGNHWLIAKKD
jgi:hypothetical protein